MNADSADRARIDDDQVGLIVEVFRMLADATRVQVLWALVDRELSVNELAEFVGKPAPSVSQHLAKLRMARLVRTRRAGTTIYYSIENEHVRQLVSDAVFNAEHAGPGVPAHHRGEVRAADRAEGGPVVAHTLIPHSHDAADSVDSALESSAIGIRAVKISLVALGVTALAQAAIVFVSGSVALAADTIHNFSDAIDSGAVVDRVRAGHPRRNAALHLRLRPRRRSGRALRGRDDRPVGRRRGLRGRRCG